MPQNQLQSIDKLEADLWEAADQLRANSKLTSSDYFMPVLGIIFLFFYPINEKLHAQMVREIEDRKRTAGA